MAILKMDINFLIKTNILIICEKTVHVKILITMSITYLEEALLSLCHSFAIWMVTLTKKF